MPSYDAFHIWLASKMLNNGSKMISGVPMKENTGFSLVEILVAVVIIGIISSVAIPSYQNHVATSEVNRCYNFLNTSRLVVDNLIQLAGNDASGITVTDFADGADDCDAGFLVENEDSDGNIDVIGSADVVGQPQVEITLSRTGANGTWNCTSNADGTSTKPDIAVIPDFCQ